MIVVVVLQWHSTKMCAKSVVVVVAASNIYKSHIFMHVRNAGVQLNLRECKLCSAWKSRDGFFYGFATRIMIIVALSKCIPPNSSRHRGNNDNSQNLDWLRVCGGIGLCTFANLWHFMLMVCSIVVSVTRVSPQYSN